MKLTDKAREDFLKVFGVDDEDKQISLQYFYNKTEVERNALIIEWLDSVGIYINPKYNEVCKEFSYSISCEPIIDDIFTKAIFKERTEATNAAIEKANKLYNYESR